jgi:hypothetical protein
MAVVIMGATAFGPSGGRRRRRRKRSRRTPTHDNENKIKQTANR